MRSQPPEIPRNLHDYYSYLIPCTNHYFLVGQILICQWKWPPLTDVIFLHHRVLSFVSSEYWWTSKPWVQIYFSVRNFRILAAMVFSSCESDDGVERLLQRGRENVVLRFSFGPSYLPLVNFVWWIQHCGSVISFTLSLHVASKSLGQKIQA